MSWSKTRDVNEFAAVGPYVTMTELAQAMNELGKMNPPYFMMEMKTEDVISDKVNDLGEVIRRSGYVALMGRCLEVEQV